METVSLGVEPRIVSKNSAVKLRKQGMVPAVIYHKGEKTISVSINEIALNKLVHSAESYIVNLQFPDGKTRRSFIKEVQFDPVTDRIMHTDFQLFTADEVVEMDVPVSVSGNAVGVEKGGKLQILRHSLTLKGQPADMPDHIVIDSTELEIGHSIHIKEIPMQAYPGLLLMDDPDTPVVTVTAPKKEAESEEESEPETSTEE